MQWLEGSVVKMPSLQSQHVESSLDTPQQITEIYSMMILKNVTLVQHMLSKQRDDDHVDA